MGTTYHGAIGQSVLIGFQLNPRSGAFFPRALIYDATDTLRATVDLVHVVDGFYQEGWPVPTAEQFSVKFEIYSDAGHTVDVTDCYEVTIDHIVGDLAGVQPPALKPHSIDPARIP